MNSLLCVFKRITRAQISLKYLELAYKRTKDPKKLDPLVKRYLSVLQAYSLLIEETRRLSNQRAESQGVYHGCN